MAMLTIAALRGSARCVMTLGAPSNAFGTVSASVTHVPGLFCYLSSRLLMADYRCQSASKENSVEAGDHPSTVA